MGYLCLLKLLLLQIIASIVKSLDFYILTRATLGRSALFFKLNKANNSGISNKQREVCVLVTIWAEGPSGTPIILHLIQ